MDHRGCIDDVNQLACTSLGYQRVVLLGQRLAIGQPLGRTLGQHHLRMDDARPRQDIIDLIMIDRMHADRRAEDCHFYAREQAYRYAPPGAGAMGGVARGAVGGAVFGAIVGGGRGARRGALAGGALGAVANGARNQADRDYAYRRAHDDCMDGYRR